MQRRVLLAGFGLAGLTFANLPARAEDDQPSGSGAWEDVRDTLFKARPITDGGDRLKLETPYRALDAAIVPMTIALAAPASPADQVRTVWLIIDENPAPVAAVVHLPDQQRAFELQTRVRVNAYTDVHAVAETADGRLLGVSHFVKAAGGCSAPALKDPAEMEARRGRMKLRELNQFAAGQPLEAQLLISHPQYTGMQIDQVSRNWIPPDYLTRIDVAFAGRPVMSIDGDISLSEDPSLTFAFVPDRPGDLTVAATDSKGRAYKESFALGQGS